MGYRSRTPPPFAKARSLVGGRGHTVGNVDSYVDDVCLVVECRRGGGIPWGRGGGGGLRRGDAAPYIYIYISI